jgi:hypothetical protein
MKIGTALFWGFLFFAFTLGSCYALYCEMQTNKAYIAQGYVYKIVGDRWYERRYEWVVGETEMLRTLGEK